MPEPETHTPVRRVRIPNLLWMKFGEVAGTRGRSAVLIEFIRWYVGEPKAKLPKPPKKPAAE